MAIQRTNPHPLRLMAAILLAGVSSQLAGCSPELASIDDVYVPASVDENFPIDVQDRPVTLTVPAGVAGLELGDVNDVIALARKSVKAGSSSLMVSYPSGSKQARRVADQAAMLLVHQGVARSAIRVTSYEGHANTVTLATVTKIAVTRECGDWSENLRATPLNDSGSNFGCTYQQNVAAMVSDPDDFNGASPMTPAQSAAQTPALEKYNSGEWTTPPSDAQDASTAAAN